MALKLHTGDSLCAAFLFAYGGNLHVETLTHLIYESRLGEVTQKAEEKNRVKSVTSYLSKYSWFDPVDGTGSWSVNEIAIKNEDVQLALRDVFQWIQEQEDPELKERPDSVQVDELWQQVRKLREERRKLYNELMDYIEIHPSMFGELRA